MFLTEAKNVVLLGPPGTGKKHLAVGIGIKAAKAGQRVLFDTATGWVSRLQGAHSHGKLPTELARLRRYSLLIVHEVGYIPFDQHAANLFFQLVSSRYEHASLVTTSNLPFDRWGDVFGDLTIASTMIDRIVVHHADVVSLRGNSYRLKQHEPATRAYGCVKCNAPVPARPCHSRLRLFLVVRDRMIRRLRARNSDSQVAPGVTWESLAGQPHIGSGTHGYVLARHSGEVGRLKGLGFTTSHRWLPPVRYRKVTGYFWRCRRVDSREHLLGAFAHRGDSHAFQIHRPNSPTSAS